MAEPQSPELPEVLRLLDQVGTADDPYSEGGPWSYAKDKGGRCFFITNNERHHSGRVLLAEETIEKAVDRKGMTRWAWVRHDKDTYTTKEAEEVPGAVEGEPKSNHFHIAIKRKSFASIAQVATAFGVPPQQVEVKPESAFLDLVEYLTHENPNQAGQGKYVYDDAEVMASFYWRTELTEHQKNRAAGGKVARVVDGWLTELAEGRLTLREVRTQAQQQGELPLYNRHRRLLEDARRDFMLYQPPPPLRITYYIEGGSGVGKTFLARLLAVSLFPDMEPEEIYFETGSSKVALQNYKGQLVIIWDDYRPGDLISALGSRTAVWRAFDPSPGRSEENIKNGSVRLVQQVNIVTGVTPYKEFIEGLAGTYVDDQGKRHQAEDPRQAYRRIRFINKMTADEIVVLVNANAMDHSADWKAYQEVMTMDANCRSLAETIDALDSDEERDEFRRMLGNRMLDQMVRHHHNVRPKGRLTLEEAKRSLDSVKVIEGEALEAKRSAEAEAAREAAEEVQRQRQAEDLAKEEESQRVHGHWFEQRQQQGYADVVEAAKHSVYEPAD